MTKFQVSKWQYFKCIDWR